MLPKQNRIKRKKDFEIIFRKGTTYKNKSLVLRVLKNNLGICRFAVITSQKVSKKSVERNKIRRRINYLIKNNLLGLRDGFDFVFLVLPGAKELKFDELKKEISDLFKKQNV